MLYVHLRRLREEPLTCKLAHRWRVDRAAASEEEKGRKFRRGSRHPTIQEKLDLGRQLLAMKAKLPRGHFGSWARDESGLSPSIVQQCLRLAKSGQPLAADGDDTAKGETDLSRYQEAA